MSPEVAERALEDAIECGLLRDPVAVGAAVD